MSLPNRKYFIIIDKDREIKNELGFSISFFYLKSMKKGTLSYINTPFFRGTVYFGLDIKNKMRPLQFIKTTPEGRNKPVDPKLFRRFVFSPKNQFIAFSIKASNEEISPITEMLHNFQFREERIKKLAICETCLDEKKFSILTVREQINSFKGQIICPTCGMKLILREMEMKGFTADKKISPKLKNFFNHMLLKFRDIQKVLSTFNADFNPTKQSELTLYDVEQNTPVRKKYLDVKIDEVEIPENLKQILKDSNIQTLLPIQAISIDNGLLSEQNNQLIMAPTSGGKTLIGELAGISSILNNRDKKMIYLVPIVALANVRMEEFKEKYKSLKLSIIKKVGESLLEKSQDMPLEALKKADIIIATYEAIDFILRSGKRTHLGDIGTIIVDEIQTLIDSDRGYLLDGFIARLKSLYPNAQYLYLSATLGEPKALANKLGCQLIQYNNRPVPVERHMIICLNETMKQKFIIKLVKGGFYKKSKYGFKGQSIVFTNTRKKCEALAEYLSRKELRVRAYHSGLTHDERKVIESDFQLQKISAVVSTAALAAGVDFPASQVIFESLAMGIKWLTVAEFEQMLGRAGRLQKHDLGLSYLLVEPGKVYSPSMVSTEENIAIKLLNGKIKDFELEPNDDKSTTELLSFLAMFDEGVDRIRIEGFCNALINNSFEHDDLIKNLSQHKLIRIKNDFNYKITKLGRALAKSFLTVKEGLDIILILKKKERNLIDIALELEPIRNVYLSKEMVADLSKNVNMKYMSNNLFSASVLSLLTADNVKKKRGNYSKELIDFLSILIKDVFNCTCQDNPYCDCGRINLERIIISLRCEDKFSVEEIREHFLEKYKISVFKGDVIDYLENVLYSLESIKNIAEGITSLDPSYREELESIPEMIKRIKG